MLFKTDGIVRVEQNELLRRKARMVLKRIDEETACRIFWEENSEFAMHRGLAEILGVKWRFQTENPIKIEFLGRLRPYQQEAVNQLASKDSYYLEAPTGSGKTVIALALVAKIKQRTLFVVPTTLIGKQIVEMAEKFLGVRAGVDFGGKAERLNADIVVTTVQKLIRRSKPVYGFGCSCIDECHHIPASAFIRSLQLLPMKYRYGFTATLSRKDELGKAFRFLLSSRVYKIGLPQVGKSVSRPKIIFIRTGISVKEADFCLDECRYNDRCTTSTRKCRFFEKGFWNYLQESLLENERRNEILKKLIRQSKAAGKSTLVLLTRIQSVVKLAKETEARFCHGQMRWKPILEDFKKNGGVLIATEQLLGEGLDAPDCEVLILGMPAGGKTRVKQRIGRIMRPKENETTVYDLVDDGFPKKLMWARKRIYEKMGLEVKWERKKGENRV